MQPRWSEADVGSEEAARGGRDGRGGRCGGPRGQFRLYKSRPEVVNLSPLIQKKRKREKNKK